MCMQCMAGAMAAATGAAGARSWLAAHAPRWMTPRRRRLASRALIALGLLGAALIGPSPG